MRLGRLTGLEREKLEAEYKELWDAHRLPRGPARRREEADGRDHRRAASDQRRVRRRAPHQDRRRRGRDPHRGADRRGGHGRHAHAPRLHQAHAASREYQAQGRGGRGITGRDVGRRRLRRRHVRGVDPRPPAAVHRQGPRLLQEGVRAARGRAHREGPRARQRARPAGRRAGRRDAAVQGVRARTRACSSRPQSRHGQEDRARRSSRTCARAASRRSRSTTATASSAPRSITKADDVLLTSRARASRCASREERVRPMGRNAAGVRGISLRDGDRLVGMCTFPRDSQRDADHGVRARLRQAHRARRLPDQEPRRQGRDHDQDDGAQRPGLGRAHRHRRRSPDPDLRPRQADPHARHATSRCRAARRRACA